MLDGGQLAALTDQAKAAAQELRADSSDREHPIHSIMNARLLRPEPVGASGQVSWWAPTNERYFSVAKADKVRMAARGKPQKSANFGGSRPGSQRIWRCRESYDFRQCAPGA
jgi:hypothetical protein